jgi:predicted Zn-dependent protease
VIDSFPGDKEFLNQARAAIRNGDFDGAAQALEKVHPISQNDPAVMRARWLIEAAGGQWEACLALARNLVTASPDNAACWVALGKSLIRIGEYDEANEILSRAATRFPSHESVCRLLAAAKDKLAKEDSEMRAA